MMATRPAPPNPPAASMFRPSTRGSSSRTLTTAVGSSSRFSRRPVSVSRPSADLAGRTVALSIDVPAVFDATLAPHHKMIGHWAVTRDDKDLRYTRQEARQRIERIFEAAVVEVLKPFELADLRVVALVGDDGLTPALAIICDSIGQLDLGWIEKSNVLRHTAFGNVAPLGWRAAAYQALCQTLISALPIFGYEDLFEEISAYYWDGATDDESARQCLIEYHGADEGVLDDMTLPSQMNARRPDWMTAKSAPLSDMPINLRRALRRVRNTHAALKSVPAENNAWRFDIDLFHALIPGFEECSHLPPMTLVPFDEFARELDDIGRHGMEQGFMDVAGICALTDVGKVDAWFASLKLGAEFLLAAQDLIKLDPANPVRPQ